ncbi:type IV toxin-antitoxin system AbiEi family antitoxin domain-containing protein [Gordonia sp. CPCC 205515]|uniref:type IV toxin-antitoxin system AbiEi family antitoxin domain-containing protein n=1 Tax=Gordonia sp. CPCC 205515 TaxID=3140791 RepID=UPI003AF3F442
MDFEALVTRYCGVMSTRQLLQAGYAAKDIHDAVDSGALDRLRHGWYATPDAVPGVVESVRDHHGVHSCISGLRTHGVWIPQGYDGTHSRITRDRRRSAPNRCLRYGRPTPPVGAIDDPLTCVQYCARCLSEEDFIIVCDSAMQLGKFTPADLAHAFRHAPDQIRRAITKCDRLAGSGTETAARLRLRSAGMKVEVQHHVPGVGYVDLLVGDCLTLELDSRDHHTGEENYESDRERDRKLIAQHYIPLHLTYRQVFREWAETFADIQLIVRQRIHRGRRSA